MKMIKNSVVVLIALMAVSCGGPKKPGADQVDQFIESLMLRMDLAQKSYDNFLIGVPEQQNIMSGSMVVTFYDQMVKQLKEEREKINAVKTFEADESAKAKSEALKQAAIDVLDTYLDGADKELKEVKTLVSKGKTRTSAEVNDQLNQFIERINKKMDAFGKIQQELAKEFGIILY